LWRIIKPDVEKTVVANLWERNGAMLSILVLDAMHKEESNISGCLETAFRNRELPIKRLTEYHKLKPLLENAIGQVNQFNVFIASFVASEIEYLKLSKMIRQKQENIFIVFAVDKSVDVAVCARPSIRPSGILFIPLEKQRIYQTIKEIYIEYTRKVEQYEHPVFTIKNGGEYFSVNTGDISFFEAQGKKIAIKTRGQEILFYSNFDSVLEQLPDFFIRCHKGYVVNTKLIAQASFTDMCLKLGDQSVIPFSRTYRDQVRAIMESKGLRGNKVYKNAGGFLAAGKA
jgi:DNA-binding LytR/AlgR family response regulator